MLRVVLADGALTGDFFVSDIDFTVLCFSLLVVLISLLPLPFDVLLFDLSMLGISFFDFSAALEVDNFSSPLFEQLSKVVVDFPLFTSPPVALHVGFLGTDLTMGMLQRSA